MPKNFLDYDGLAYLISKIKGMFFSEGIVTTGGDGNAYTATVTGISELKPGVSFVMVPHVVSTAVTPTLNVNGLGAKVIRRRLSNSTTSTAAGSTAGWIAANKPIRMMYDGSFWIAELDIPNANDLYGTLSVEKGGTGGSTSEAALTNIGAQAKHIAATVTIPASGWSGNQQTVNVSGATASNTVIVSASPDNHEEYTDSGIRCTAQGEGTLTFRCENTPNTDIKANVTILN